MNKTVIKAEPGQRGPADHAVREQIVLAAKEHFSRYGYAKTTVSDMAEAIGFSKAYIYRFFDSKQAIGEAICTQCLTAIGDQVEEAISTVKPGPEQLRKLLRTQVEGSISLFFSERKLYDIAAHSASEKWSSALKYIERIDQLVSDVITAGRKAGEFERKTPLDETCRAIGLAMQPFTHPMMLQFCLDDAPVASNEVINLILRSLAP